MSSLPGLRTLSGSLRARSFADPATLAGWDISFCDDASFAAAWWEGRRALPAAGVPTAAATASVQPFLPASPTAAAVWSLPAGPLLAGFFDFYVARADLLGSTVCVRSGKLLDKTGKSAPKAVCKVWQLSIQDPFDVNRNLGVVIRNVNFAELTVEELQRAAVLLQRGLAGAGAAAAAGGPGGGVKLFNDVCLSWREDSTA